MRAGGDLVLHDGEHLSLGEVFRIDDPLVGFSLIPNSSRIVAKGGAFMVKERINSKGLRDIEHDLPKRPGARRILVLGDSFMYGDGVEIEETMPRRLAECLPGVEVINAGVRGYDLGQELLSYRHRLRAYGPDLVLLAFFMNDLGPDPHVEAVDGPDGLPLLYRTKPDYLARYAGRDSRWWLLSMPAWLRSHSMLYVLLRDRWDDLRARRAGMGPAPEGAPSDLPYVAAFEVTPPDGSIPDGWRRAYRILDELKRQIASEGSRLAIVMVPAPWQISAGNWEAWVKWLKADPVSLGRRHPQEMVAAWCDRTGTPCHDLIADFEGGDRTQLYFLHEYHWSAEGHALAARAVAAFLTASQLP